MRREQSVRVALRAATADAHARVDRIYSTFDLARRADYGLFLQAQAAALLPLECALDAGAAPHLGLDWQRRRRTGAILHDLDTLSLPVPRSQSLPPIDRPGAALGTLYVLEGSRLGGALLARSVPSEYPAAFLAPAPTTLWRAFLEILETTLQTGDQRNEAVRAAEAAFKHFELSGRAMRESAAR